MLPYAWQLQRRFLPDYGNGVCLLFAFDSGVFAPNANEKFLKIS